jgi:hypothetical protein
MLSHIQKLNDLILKSEIHYPIRMEILEVLKDVITNWLSLLPSAYFGEPSMSFQLNEVCLIIYLWICSIYETRYAFDPFFYFFSLTFYLSVERFLNGTLRHPDERIQT